MSVLQWLLDQLQRGYAYLIGLTDEVVTNVIAAGIVMLIGAVWTRFMLRAFRRRRKEKDHQVFDEAFLRRQRQAMLEVVERQWIEGRLEHSLHYQAPIFLGLMETPEAVERPWEYEIQTPGQPPSSTRDTGDILDVFDACGSLLILGAPGSGKTVTLLDLARQLIERARGNGDAPLPVIFVLASWAQEKKPLDEWMVSEMERQYRVPLALGRHWVERREVLPLLDGLDEVKQSARAACVEAINAYRSKAVGGAAVVICSRETEYAQLSARLKVDGAVTLQPLDDQQVRQHLRRFGKQTAMLARSLAGNDQLRELARTPLWLDVMAVAYSGDDTATAPKVASTGDIFDAYIRRVLLGHRQPLREWAPGQCMYWLRWLAQHMERSEQTLFRLEEIQITWLGSRAEQRQYRWWLWWWKIVGTVLLGGLGFGLVRGALGLLIVSSSLGLGVGLLADELDTRGKQDFVATAPRLAWNWHKMRPWVIGGIICGLLTGLSSGLLHGLGFGLESGMVIMLLILLCGGVLGLRIVHEIGESARANQSTWQSARNGVIAGLGFGLTSGLLILLAVGVQEALLDVFGSERSAYGVLSGLLAGKRTVELPGMGIALVLSGLSGGLMFSTAGGGLAISHWLLRWRLWRERMTPQPWRYVAFLDAMAGRPLLDQIGGAYKFKHDLLQKHIAALDDAFIATLAQGH